MTPAKWNVLSQRNLTMTPKTTAATLSESAMEVIAAKVYDPSEPSIFGKGKKSDLATFTQIHCSCDSCPLRAKRQCVLVAIFSPRCPYGKLSASSSPSQRSKGYRDWVRQHREQAKPLGWMGFAAKKLAFVGEHVYLPYSHMGMCKTVEFQKHSSVFVSGAPFIERAAWTIETVLRLIDFVPMSMMGGAITNYQKEEVPLFVSHIRELDSEMWAKLIVARPEFDKEPNYVGRKAVIRTLAYPITIPPKDALYPVSWKWDGVTLTTSNRDAYRSTWGGIDVESLALTAVPSPNATVKVASNSWVTKDTVFVD